jgi:hypothetical protein
MRRRARLLRRLRVGEIFLENLAGDPIIFADKYLHHWVYWLGVPPAGALLPPTPQVGKLLHRRRKSGSTGSFVMVPPIGCEHDTGCVPGGSITQDGFPPGKLEAATTPAIGFETALCPLELMRRRARRAFLIRSGHALEAQSHRTTDTANNELFRVERSCRGPAGASARRQGDHDPDARMDAALHPGALSKGGRRAGGCI